MHTQLREHCRSSQMPRPDECPPCALHLARRILYSLALRLLKFPRLRHLPQIYSDENGGVRAHSCARRPDRAVGTPPLNSNTPAIRPTFVGACWSVDEQRNCQSHFAYPMAISLGRISRVIQNFERAVPCYNTFFRPIYPHLTSSHAVRVSTSIWASKKTQVRKPLPSLDPPSLQHKTE